MNDEEKKTRYFAWVLEERADLRALVLSAALGPSSVAFLFCVQLIQE